MGDKFSECDEISTKNNENRSNCFKNKIKNLSESRESQNEIIDDLLARLDLLGNF